MPVQRRYRDPAEAENPPSAVLVDSAIEITKLAPNVYISFVHTPGSIHRPCEAVPSLHTQFCPGHDLGTDRINQHLTKAAHAALTKILPGKEDRFGK
jgi:hypothetical protein